MTDWAGDSTSRRAVLRAGLAAGSVVVAGCSGGGSGTETGAADDGEADATATSTATATAGDTPTTTETATETETETPTATEVPGLLLEDDFEDGDYTSDPSWRRSYSPDLDDSIFTVDVVERESPAGGTMAVQLSDSSDPPNRSEVGDIELAQTFDQLGEPWVIEGLASPVEIPDYGYQMSVEFEAVPSEEASERDREYRLLFEFFSEYINMNDEAENRIRMTTRAPGMSYSEVPRTTQPATPVEQDRWYRWELRHDGEGSYTGRRWPADGSRSQAVQATVDFQPFPENATLSINAHGGRNYTRPPDDKQVGAYPFTADLDYVRLQLQ